MIQRIQSVYLLGASILLEFSASVLYLLPDNVFTGYRLGFLFAPAVLGIAGLGAVFLFKRRELQVRVVKVLGAINILIVVALLTASYLTGDLTKIAAGGPFAVITGVFLAPVIASILFFHAGKAVQRDIDLIRSMDRIR
jgi:hypothetical protein